MVVSRKDYIKFRGFFNTEIIDKCPATDGNAISNYLRGIQKRSIPTNMIHIAQTLSGELQREIQRSQAEIATLTRMCERYYSATQHVDSAILGLLDVSMESHGAIRDIRRVLENETKVIRMYKRLHNLVSIVLTRTGESPASGEIIRAFSHIPEIKSVVARQLQRPMRLDTERSPLGERPTVAGDGYQRLAPRGGDDSAISTRRTRPPAVSVSRDPAPASVSAAKAESRRAYALVPTPTPHRMDKKRPSAVNTTRTPLFGLVRPRMAEDRGGYNNLSRGQPVSRMMAVERTEYDRTINLPGVMLMGSPKPGDGRESRREEMTKVHLRETEKYSDTERSVISRFKSYSGYPADYRLFSVIYVNLNAREQAHDQGYGWDVDRVARHVVDEDDEVKGGTRDSQPNQTPSTLALTAPIPPLLDAAAHPPPADFTFTATASTDDEEVVTEHATNGGEVVTEHATNGVGPTGRAADPFYHSITDWI